MTTYNNAVELSKLVSPVFSKPHRALKSGEVNQLVLKGGRGSTKSSYASVETLLQLLKHKDIHAVVMRKVGSTILNSVYAQYQWAIIELGLYDKFKFTKQPMQMEYLPTGQTILFFGADDPGKLKSLKVPFGYVGVLHLEELDQFTGEEEVRNIEQSVLRGGPIAFEIKTFNPPRTKDNWANKYCLKDKPNQLIHKSTYLTTPREWLGERFIADAEYLKENNPTAYEHEYLGVPTGSGGMVFDNLKGNNITDTQIEIFDHILNGVDWGWFPDPWAYNRCHFDAARRTLYIFAEEERLKTSNEETAKIVKKYTALYDEIVTCDSAEHKSTADYQSYGITARDARKGPNSIEYSMKWLQSLNAIVIDPIRCPKTYKEFSDYEYEKNKQGEIISGYVDKNNHHIDAVRYATERIWRRNGQ